MVRLFLLACKCDAVIYAFSRHDFSVTFTQFKQETGAMFPFFLALHMSHTRQAQHDTNEKKKMTIIIKWNIAALAPLSSLLVVLLLMNLFPRTVDEHDTKSAKVV